MRILPGRDLSKGGEKGMNLTGHRIAWERESVVGRRPSSDMPRSYKDLDPGVRKSGLTGKKAFGCPECREEFKTPEILAVHLERHRPVDGPIYSIRKKLRSILCPHGCGRYFKLSGDKRPNPEASHHFRTCDGSSPLKVR